MSTYEIFFQFPTRWVVIPIISLASLSASTWLVPSTERQMMTSSIPRSEPVTSRLAYVRVVRRCSAVQWPVHHSEGCVRAGRTSGSKYRCVRNACNNCHNGKSLGNGEAHSPVVRWYHNIEIRKLVPKLHPVDCKLRSWDCAKNFTRSDQYYAVKTEVAILNIFANCPESLRRPKSPHPIFHFLVKNRGHRGEHW